MREDRAETAWQAFVVLLLVLAFLFSLSGCARPRDPQAAQYEGDGEPAGHPRASQEETDRALKAADRFVERKGTIFIFREGK